MTWLKTTFAALLVLALGACGDGRAPLVVGGKNFAENMIVAEMIASLAEDAGIPVTRRIGLGSTQLTLEALKRGDIDVYPEYNGTGLVMLGQPPMQDGDAALGRVRELFAPLGLSWGQRFGFANDYGLAMRRERARALDIETISDLTAQAETLTLGIEDDFRTRPLDGFDALTRRYGMTMGEIREVPLPERDRLYDLLIDGLADVILVYTTDSQIADFDLLLLADDRDFFPVYEAAPLVRDAALARLPELQNILDQLAGQLDTERMRLLNGRVAVLGEDPSQVARAELIRLGLLEGVAAEAAQTPLTIAVSLSASADGEAAAVLRAARRAFPGRNVALAPSADPLAAVGNGEARMAMIGAPGFFANDEAGLPALREGFEAVGLVGSTFVHIFALDPAVESLADVAEVGGWLATGPVGSTGHRAAQMILGGLDLDIEVTPVSGGNAEALAAAIRESGAAAAILMQPLGNATVRQLLDDGLRLVPIDGWEDGNNRIVYPYLQPARLTAADYAGIERPIDTLSAQLLLAGPAPRDERTVGDQGPGASFIPGALPIAANTVRALDAALGQAVDIHPILPQARALAPAFPAPPAALNPAPAVSLLSGLVIVMLVWMGWLLFRPEYRK